MSGIDVIVIGGGIAGLSAALHLAERGLHLLILEADEKFLGGRLAGGETVQVGEYNFRLEHGMHGIWSQYRNFQAMLARHNLRPVFVPARDETWVYRDGNFMGMAPVGTDIRRSVIPPPFHYLQLLFNCKFLWMLDLRDWLSLVNVWAGLVMAVGIDPLAENQPMRGITLGRLTRNWSPAFKAFFLGLARNGLSSHPDEVPISGFIAFLRFYTLLRRDAWIFSYLPDDGGTSICEPLGARIQQLGGRIQLGTRAKRIVRDGDSWLVESDSESARASEIVLAVDSKNSEQILRSSFGSQAEGLFFPQALATAVVRLWFDIKLNVPEAGIFTGDFTAHNFFWLDQLTNSFRRWSRETGGSALEMHIYGPPETLTQPDAVLLARAITDAQQVWTGLRGHVIKSHLQRNDETHTLPEVGGQLGIVTPWDGLFCAGDWVAHPMPSFFLERACATGIEAANAILEKRGLDKFPLIDYLPPEPFVAWIEKLMVKGRKRVAKKKRTY